MIQIPQIMTEQSYLKSRRYIADILSIMLDRLKERDLYLIEVVEKPRDFSSITIGTFDVHGNSCTSRYATNVRIYDEYKETISRLKKVQHEVEIDLYKPMHGIEMITGCLLRLENLVTLHDALTSEATAGYNRNTFINLIERISWVKRYDIH